MRHPAPVSDPHLVPNLGNGPPARLSDMKQSGNGMRRCRFVYCRASRSAPTVFSRWLTTSWSYQGRSRLIGPGMTVKMVVDREGPLGSLGYLRDNSTNAAPIDDDVVPAGARVDTAEMADRSTTKTHKIHRGHRPRDCNCRCAIRVRWLTVSEAGPLSVPGPVRPLIPH